MSSEKKGILFSIIASAMMAAFGIFMAIYTSSDAILLDGMFNLLSAILSLGSIVIAIFVNRKYTKRHPMGFYAYEAFMIFVKGLFILGLVIMAIISNITVLLTGGREPNLIGMICYGIPALVVNLFAWMICYLCYKKMPTGLIEAEYKSWSINTLITAIIVFSLILVFFLRHTQLGFIIRYIDQILVIILCFVTFMDPIHLITNSFRELMLQSISSNSKDSFQHVLQNHPQILENFYLENITVFKIGRGMWIYLDIKSRTNQVTLQQFILCKKELSKLATSLYNNTEVVLTLVE